jgi:hypothetical protein
MYAFGEAAKYSQNVKFIQIECVAEEIHSNRAAGNSQCCEFHLHSQAVAILGDFKAVLGQLNEEIRKRSYHFPTSR